ELAFDGPTNEPAGGTLEIAGVNAITPAGETDLAVRAGSKGFGWRRADRANATEPPVDERHPNRLAFVPGDRSKPEAIVDETGAATTLRLSSVPAGPVSVPAIAGASFLTS